MQDTNYTCGIVNKELSWRDYQIAQQTTGGQKLRWSVTAVLSLGCSASADLNILAFLCLFNLIATEQKVNLGQERSVCSGSKNLWVWVIQ